MNDLEARVILARITEPADARCGERVMAVGAPQVLDEIRAGHSPLPHAASLRIRLDAMPSLDDDIRRTHAIGARILVPGNPQWPSQLNDLGARAPLALWVLGEGSLRLLLLRSVAIVGARAATPYGEACARRMAADLAGDAWTVVSGGAFGIDAAAHRGALAAGGVTLCVLPGGIDVTYPRAHEDLLRRIAGEGLLVSESPPGCAPLRQRFLTRNRLIAAMTRATVMVEAALRSGSRNTAGEASSLGRHVLAVPGPVSSTMSAGCHALIRSGEAVLCRGADDVRELIEPVGAVVAVDRAPSRAEDALGPSARRVLDATPLRRPATVASIAVAAGITPVQVATAMIELEAAALVVPSGAGWRRAAMRSAG